MRALCYSQLYCTEGIMIDRPRSHGNLFFFLLRNMHVITIHHNSGTHDKSSPGSPALWQHYKLKKHMHVGSSVLSLTRRNVT